MHIFYKVDANSFIMEKKKDVQDDFQQKHAMIHVGDTY